MISLEHSQLDTWEASPVSQSIARAHRPPPDIDLHEWASQEVWLENEDAAEPGLYRSAKTPWTRRLQSYLINPVMWCWDYDAQKYVQIPVTEIFVQKSSQSGFTEACLNGIRWYASFRPRNCIYAIDTEKNGAKVARRLLRSLKHLDEDIFHGDPDDVKKLEFLLRGMELNFVGSFSEGDYTQKQAPLLFADEVEEHGKSQLKNLASRKKTSTGGLQVNLSKPKFKDGPINAGFQLGNQEKFKVPCPHCGHRQHLTFFSVEEKTPFSEQMVDVLDEATGQVLFQLQKPLPLGETREVRTGRFVYEHCKNSQGQWDELRILRDTKYECGNCLQLIDEAQKPWMRAQGEMVATAIGRPGIVSQHCSDFLSEDELSTWGLIVLEYLEAKKKDDEALRVFYNHRCGDAWTESQVETTEADILANMSGRTLYFVDAPNSKGQIRRHEFTAHETALAYQSRRKEKERIETEILTSFCPAYTRGIIPFVPNALVIGSDVGGNYAKWALLALHPNMRDAAVIDWAEELDPDAIAHLMLNETWLCQEDGKQYRAKHGFIDCRYRTEEVWKASLATRCALIPCMGIGGAAARTVRLWSYQQVVSMPKGFKKLDYSDKQAKDGLYEHGLKYKKNRIWFPTDVLDDPDFIAEMTAEKKEDGVWPETTLPNHFGDCVKNAVTGIRFLTRQMDTRSPAPTP